MEVRFDIVKPNLYVHDDSVYFGIDDSDVVRVGKIVDETITKHIGTLNVTKEDLETIKFGISQNIDEYRYDTPLNEYLEVMEVQDINPNITNKFAELFDVSHVIDARTMESPCCDIINWIKIQGDLANPNKVFDELDKNNLVYRLDREKNNLVYRLDREKTLIEMEKLKKELEQKIPDNYAEFIVVNGEIASKKQTIKTQCLGVVGFVQLKAKDKTKINEAKTDLIGRLKEFDGPCLSFDAPLIYVQTRELYSGAPELVRKYGDILTSPTWKTRFFRLDP